MSRQPAQAKNWCFTYNNPIMEPRLVKSMRYLMFGREVGEQGTPHLQGYVQFHVQKRFLQVKELLPFVCHLSVAKGTHSDNRIYCSKDGDFL